MDARIGIQENVMVVSPRICTPLLIRSDGKWELYACSFPIPCIGPKRNERVHDYAGIDSSCCHETRVLFGSSELRINR